MTHEDNARNLDEWIRKIFPHVEIVSIDPTEYEFTTLGYDNYHVDIDVFEKGYNVRAMSWYYEFKEAEEVIDFIKGWKLFGDETKITCPFCGGNTYSPQSQGIKIQTCYQCNNTGVMSNSQFTCYTCPDVGTCRSAYNAYNTNGDCLESK